MLHPSHYQHHNHHHDGHHHHYHSPHSCCKVCTSQGTIALDANVQRVINAIMMCQVIPYGDYGGSTVYYFCTRENDLGNIIYTVFDKTTTLGLASFMVRFGSAATIRQILFEPFPRSQIDLQYLILPCVPFDDCCNGTVTP